MRAALAFFLALVLAAPAPAAERRFTVPSFEKVRIDGPYDVVVATNVSPYAKAVGDWEAIDKLVLSVEGNTLVVRPPAGAPAPTSMAKLKIMVGTPGLKAAALNGAGRLSIDKVRSLSFNIVAVGAGSVEVAAMDVDQLTVALSGVASSRLAGKAKSIDAMVQGTSALDASALKSANVKLGAQGAAVARLFATDSAKIQVAGPVTVAIDGKPACTVKQNGSGSVSGC